MSVKEIGLIWITVKDLEKAIEFYTKVVGLKVVERSDEWKWAELAGHDGGSRLGLGEECSEMEMRAGQNAVVTLTVDSIDKTLKEVGAKVKLLGDVQVIPGHVKMQLCADSDGNLFQYVELLHK